MRVLVTGGAGYIGSHTVRELLDRGHQVCVLDNLGHGHRAAVDPRAEFVHANTYDTPILIQTLERKKIEAVVHFAADIEVGESVVDPAKYYQNNFSNTILLLNGILKAGVKKIVFSSTAAVYGNPDSSPLTEESGRQPINPYGRSKMMVELALADYASAYGLGSTILRYFNVAGAHPSAEIGEDHHPESHLIPRILASARDGAPVKIFGTDYPTKDGTCVRDYIHVVDLANAHILALETMEPAQTKIYNLGSQTGFTVREVIAACEKVSGRQLQVVEEARRPGDPATLVASSEKVRGELGWKPIYPGIESIIQHAWKWHQTHPQGYASKKMSLQSTTRCSPIFK